MTKTYDDRELHRARIGALLITLVTAVSLAVFFVDELVRASREGPMITVTTRFAPGVQPGTDVWVAGRSVGRVVSVEFREPTDGRDRVMIRAVLERGVETFVRADAAVTIQPGALLAPVVLFIHPGSADQPPRDFDLPLRAEDQALSPEALLEMGETLRASGDRLRGEARRVATAIQRGGGTLGALRDDPDVLREAGERLSEVRRLVSEHYETGTIGRFARDTIVEARLARIRYRLTVLDTLRTRTHAAESMRQTAAALTTFHDRLTALAERLDAGEGTAGRALQDGTLARQIALLRSRLDSATVEFAKYPERWLKVKVF
ncbi:MAG: MlaD family protein [Gemmatimonadota bacterium]